MTSVITLFTSVSVSARSGCLKVKRSAMLWRPSPMRSPRFTSKGSSDSRNSPVAGEFLESLVPFDVYRGERIGEGRQSIALRFTFRHPERALTDTEVNSVMTDVISTAEGAGYDVRDR